MQRPFTETALAMALLTGAIMASADWLRILPDRQAARDSVSAARAISVGLDGPLPPPVRSARLWRLDAPDPRFGGVSALGVDRRELIALSDSGVVIRFAPPTAAVQTIDVSYHDLPDGPGPPRFKAWRDSESLTRDRLGRGWWVGFETRHSLWLFDRSFAAVLDRHGLRADWPRNKGAEALFTTPDGRLFALPERGGRSIELDGSRGPTTPRGTADATRLPDGRLALLVRRITIRGFESEVRIAATSGRPPLRLKLPLGRLANAEAIAAMPLGDGGTRLWIATDDNFKPWMRTYLLAVDLPRGI